MIRLLVSLAINLGASAVALWLADMLLDDVSIPASAFIVTVVIFSVVSALVQPLLTQMSLKNVTAMRGSVALVAAFVALFVTSLLVDDFSISGFVTWVAATVIVWLGGLLAAFILPAIFVKRQVNGSAAA